ncbi:hypothetical protein QMK19_11945 [Streptomyces sp. H10-C2]|uniref:hypothetical protein n=1 Tax=unclassified Streptomyces TaxID=2593676 RepID=UPI0024BAB7CD|nr:MULTISPECIES: hypothetical protein [unclassified Streptomyces]MDJ0341876.1 hypothetical protein [Streptomyces sp. PH10-H1]MDJ0370370.1 hypothetical protein [Streptomyces sp. H10-C2]
MNTAWSGLIDDAALFPPGDVPLPRALPAHLGYRTAWFADLVGPFVFPAPRLGELAAALAAVPDGHALDISLTVPVGAPALPPALDALAKLPAVRLAAVEIALPDGPSVGDTLTVLDRELPPEVTAHVEVPRGAFGAEVADAIAASRHHAKLRTGGTVATAFPGERELAAALIICARRGLAFKCTAGLHHALRHTDPVTGFEHHGFLNVLLATEAALDGAERDAVAALLAERSAGPVRDRVAALGADGVARVRSTFTSVGSCSVHEPVDDLTTLGLLTAPDDGTPGNRG